MYIILSALSLLPEVVLQVVYLFIGTPVYSPVVSTIIWAWMLVVRQIYLLCVNLFYVYKKKISLTRSILYMLGLIVISVGLMLGFHKMQYGVFIGDVPEQLYCFLIVAPSILVFAGVAIYAIGVGTYKKYAKRPKGGRCGEENH